MVLLEGLQTVVCDGVVACLTEIGNELMGEGRSFLVEIVTGVVCGE